MIDESLPPCRHRMATATPGQWTCLSPKVVLTTETVAAHVCRHECPYVDHAVDLCLDRVLRNRPWPIDEDRCPPLNSTVRFPQIFPAHPNPKPTDPPIFSPAHFQREPTRHLIYYIWPHNKTDNWRWNVRQLLARIELFDGVRSIGVATSPHTATLAEVQAEFGDVRIDHWIERPNDPAIGEGVCFLPLMGTLPRDDHHVTFYGHAKGVRYDSGHITLRWAAMQYRACLDHWSEVRGSLDQFPITGTFKRYSDFNIPRNWRWHYSGTYFWFRNADVFRRPEWTHLHPNFYGQVEAWPAGVFQSTEAGCIFGDDAQLLYAEEEVARWENQFKDWPADRPSSSGVSDRSFFEGEDSLRRDWLDLVCLHTQAVEAIRELGCQSVLEVGSGLGPFLHAAASEGLDATGFDVSRFQRDFAIAKGVAPDRYRLANLQSYRIEQPVDCIYCAEVFEHCPDSELIPFIQQIAANCRWFLFTSTPYHSDSDAVWGHINVKTRDEWIAFFGQHGLTFVREDVSLVEWGLLFAGQALSTAESQRDLVATPQ